MSPMKAEPCNLELGSSGLGDKGTHAKILYCRKEHCADNEYQTPRGLRSSRTQAGLYPRPMTPTPKVLLADPRQ